MNQVHEVNLSPLTQQALQSLYAIATIEIIYLATEAQTLKIAGKFPGEKPAGISLPAGHYLILKIVEPPTNVSGLAAVISPFGPGQSKEST